MSEGTSRATGAGSKQQQGTPLSEADKRAQADAAAKAKAAEDKAKADEAAVEAEAPPAEDPPAAPEPEGQDPDNPKFAVDDLVANARTLTGYGKYVLAGALSKLDGDAFTVEEAKQACEAFTSQPINPDAPENLTEVDPASGAVTIVDPAPEPTPDEPTEES